MKEPVTNKQKLYYTIGEVSDMFNVNQSLLRYWETEFKTINPKRSPKGLVIIPKKISKNKASFTIC